MAEPILIAGASARAAAASAQRAGFRVTAADMFCDGDLHSCGRAIRVVPYPHGLLPMAAQLPPVSWMYTGGLENEPDLVDAVSQRHTLWGNAGATLRQVRDPWQVAAALDAAGLRYPPPRRQPAVGGIWMRKPLRSCGGTGVRRVALSPSTPLGTDTAAGGSPHGTPHESAGPADVRAPERAWYFQPWIAGVACGAVFVAAAGDAQLIGITRQLVGCRWAGARDFQYVGSVGLAAWNAAVRDQFCRVGVSLAQAFGLRGLFGVDAIVAEDEVWTVEVNPRYTASVEVVERALGIVTIRWHRDACLHGLLPPPVACSAASAYGKAVVYATRDAVIDDLTAAHLPAAATWLAAGGIADVPPAGTRVAAGQPLLTLLTSGRDQHDVVRRLRAGARAVRRILHAAAGARAAIDPSGGWGRTK
ncbi:MAG: ATP-grasp domain-containing protein [Pirellulaceae bacterium]|jgi:predicted ATP-grasp superfamily ATP-dependent carboligase|nr:ATP-grasp domain-containing protein [Pirellulaceae bacterium]